MLGKRKGKLAKKENLFSVLYMKYMQETKCEAKSYVQKKEAKKAKHIVNREIKRVRKIKNYVQATLLMS